MREAGDGNVSLVPSPGGHGVVFEAMLELLCLCLLLLLQVKHWCNLVGVKRNIALSINAKIKSNSATAVYHWMEENKANTMAKSLSQTDYHSECCYIFCIY